MTDHNKLGEIDIKGRTYHYLDNLINVNNLDFNNVKLIKK